MNKLKVKGLLQLVANAFGVPTKIVDENGSTVPIKMRSSMTTSGAMPGLDMNGVLHEGDYLSLEGAAGTVGTLTLVSAKNEVITKVIGPGTTVVGPYKGLYTMSLVCTAGSIAATVGDAVLWSVQLSPTANAFGDSLGNLYRTDKKTLRQVATHCRTPFGIYSGIKQMMSRSAHIATDDISSLQIVLANWYGGASGQEDTTGLSDITYTAAIEYPISNGSTNATLTQIKWGGATSGVCTVGSTLISDMITLAVKIPKGQKFRVRVWASTAGSLVCTSIDNSVRQISGGPLEDIFKVSATTRTDETMSAVVSAPSAGSYPLEQNGFCPVAILSYSSSPAIAIIGDSRGQGANSRATFPTDANSWNGQAEPVVGQIGGGWINMCQYSDRAQWFTAALAPRRTALLQYVTHLYCEYGINDISSSATTAQLADRLQAIKNLPNAVGKPMICSTITPSTTGSAAQADGSDQTPFAQESVRAAWNDLLRGGGTPADYVVEIADLVESYRNSGKWKAGYRTVTDAACTAGTYAVSSATAAFTAADIGKSVYLPAAGRFGQSLVALIQAVAANGQSATINFPVGQSVASGGTMRVGDIYTNDLLHETVQAQEVIKNNVRLPLRLVP